MTEDNLSMDSGVEHLDWKSTLKALHAMRGELVQVGITEHPGGDYPVGDAPRLASAFGLIYRDGSDRGQFVLKAGAEAHAPTIGMFRVPPAGFVDAEWLETGVMLAVTVGAIVIVVVRTEAS